MVILFIAVLMAAMFFVAKILLPEMAKPPLPRAPKTVPQKDPIGLFQSGESIDRIEKLESLLAEKNKNIGLLQKELKIFYVQIQSFEKLKALLEEEIYRLKEQNRIFRSELGLPTDQPKEHSIT